MLKTLIAPAAAAFAVLLLVGTVDTAQARRGGGQSFSGGGHARSFSARSFNAPRVYSQRVVRSYRYAGQYNAGKRVRYIRKRVIVGLPLAYGYYAYSDSCYWLRRRALASGSSYWWNRYYACIEGYYDPY